MKSGFKDIELNGMILCGSLKNRTVYKQRFDWFTKQLEIKKFATWEIETNLIFA